MQNTGPRGNTGPVSKPRHRVINVDADAKLGDCSVCGQGVPVYKNRGNHFLCSTIQVERVAERRAGILAGTFNVTTKHELSAVDATGLSALCSTCGAVGIFAVGDSWICTGMLRGPQRRPYLRHRTNVCSWCGFEGHHSQMDVDHLDENHENNKLENLDTKCCRCHRLKTYLVAKKIPASDWIAIREKYGAVPRAGIEPA